MSRTDAQDRLDRLASALMILEDLQGLDMNAAIADLWAKVEADCKKAAAKSGGTVSPELVT